MLVTKKPHHVI